MEKKLKENYDKTRKRVALNFSVQEITLLEKTMQSLGITNMSSYLKYKIFGDDEEVTAKYRKLKNSSKKEDIKIIMKNLMESLDNNIGYLNYRFNYELEALDNMIGKSDDEKARKILATMTQWKKSVMERTEQVCNDCQDILKYIDINVERIKKDNVRYIPDSVLDKVAKDWNDTTSPEALEAARRVLDEFHKKMDEQKKRK